MFDLNGLDPFPILDLGHNNLLVVLKVVLPCLLFEVSLFGVVFEVVVVLADHTLGTRELLFRRGWQLVLFFN